MIGYLLGIDEHLLPGEFDDAALLLDTILARQSAPSEAGRIVTQALLDYMQGLAPGPLLDGAPPTLIRQLAGDDIAEMLAVPDSDWTRLVIHWQSAASLLYGKIGDTSALAARSLSELGVLLLKTAVRASNRGNRYDWVIPASESEHRQR